MAGQGRSTDSFKTNLHFDGSLDVVNGNELPQQRASTSALDYNGGSFMSMLLEPTPPQSPTQLSTPTHRGNTSSHYASNPGFEQNQASQGLIRMHGSLQIEPCSSSQVHPHLTKTQNEPFCSCQSAAINYMDYECNNNNSITRYGLGLGGYSSSFHQNMTVGGSVTTYRQAAENRVSTSGEGMFGRTGRTNQATFVERTSTPVMCSEFNREHNAATPLPSFFTMSYRDEQLFQVPPVNNGIERHSFPWTNNLTANPQQYGQQPSLLNQHLQNLRNLALKLCDDIDRTIQTQAALEPIRCPLLEDDDEEIETDEDEDEDMDTGEDSNAGNTDFQEDDSPNENDDDDNDNGNEAEDQNRDEEAGVMQETTGNNVNAGPVVDNTVAMQEEEEGEGEDGGDGLEVEDILAGLSMESYQPQPHLETEPPCCSICLGSFQEGERLGILDCEHRFHYICIGEWLTTKNSCPLCRKAGLAI